MVKYAAGHLVCRRLEDFEATARRLERAAQDIKSANFDQSLPALPPAMFRFSASCANIQDLTIRSVPMEVITEDHVKSVRFDRLRRLRIYYILVNHYRATASTFLLLRAMPNLEYLGIGGGGLIAEDEPEDVDFPDLPFALEAFRYSGGVSVAAAAHILEESRPNGTLKELGIHLNTNASSLETIFSAAPESLRKLDIVVGIFEEGPGRQQLVDVTAEFLKQNTRIRHLKVRLLPGISLAGFLDDLGDDNRLVSLHVKDPSLMDAEWLVTNIASSRPLATLRTLSLEYDEEEDVLPIADRTVTNDLLRHMCSQRMISLREVERTMRYRGLIM